MNRIIFATNNKHKLEEASNILSSSVQIVSLKEIGFSGDIPETGNTLIENALQKARYIFDRYAMNCMADDTGLEVEALDGRPGVYSARYAGPECSSEKNIEKLLFELKECSNRKASFKTVVALILEGKEYLFEGVVDGEILGEKSGNLGFGYDPVFKPNGSKLTFAEMTSESKNSISHRALAFNKLAIFLNQ